MSLPAPGAAALAALLAAAPAPAPSPAPEEPLPAAVSLTVSGGASLGAYEAGFLHYLAAARQAGSGQGPEVRLATGASAGSINSLLSLIYTQGGVEPDPYTGLFAKVWLDTDPDRSGLVPGLWKKGAKFVDYVEWALDVPMFMFKRDGQKVGNTGQSFRSFWKSGYQGHKPNIGDWKTHLNTLFPEVRLKNTIEVRGADSQGAKMACTLPALWTGIFYDTQALAEAEALTSDWTFDEVNATRKEVWNKALGARFRANTLQPIAEKVLAIAAGGLERRAFLSASGKSERAHLSRMEELVGKGQSPADALLEGLENVGDLRAEIIRRCDLGTGT